jgi:hypothetical protein
LAFLAVILSPSLPVILSIAKNLISAQDRLREEYRDPFPLFRVTVKTYKSSLLDSEERKT